jgi:hypothetical protein
MADTNGTTSIPQWVQPILRSYAALSSRLGLSHALGSTHDGMRDIEAVLGYKRDLSYADFKRAYVRGDLAKRIVTAWPDATWSQSPLMQDDPDSDDPTPYEQAWMDLDTRLGIYRTLSHADLLAQLGHYAVVLLGLRGQTDLRQEAAPVRGPEDVLFLQPYSEELMVIETFGADASQPTYGKPELYRLVGAGTEDTTERGLRRPTRSGRLVHASRVLHIPGQYGLDDPDIYGTPILEAVYNKLVDLLKVIGGGAEMFWRDAKRRIALEVQDGYQLTPEDAANLEQEAEEFQHGLRDFLRLMGVQAKALDGTVASPRDHFDTIMQSIAGTVRIPLRVLLGSERGELSSSQDQNEYLRQVAQRQVQYAEPRILRQLEERLLTLRALPAPKEASQVVWPNLWALSEVQQAAVTKDRASAIQSVTASLASYRGPGMGDTVITPEELRSLLATVWQSAELELAPELPPDVEEVVDLAPEPTSDGGSNEEGAATDEPAAAD